MSIYSRGSEWRRWELHTHTPCSYLNNGFGTDWDVYVKELFSKAIRYNIAAIGLTDYFTVDGYKKIKIDYLDNDSKLKELFTPDEVKKIKDILILPNIEFRLKALVDGNRINFHVLFSNEVSIHDIEENFLHELDFIAESYPHSEDECWKLKTCHLEELGRKLKSEHQNFNSDTDICVGMKCAFVDDAEIVKILTNKKSKFKDQYLIFIPSDEDLSKIDWNGQGHQIRKSLIQKSNGLMASNHKTVQWGLGYYHDSPADFVKEFRSIKPCIWGADAHCYKTLFSPANDRFCWVKANPSFNGLKQIIFEPEDRVKISDVCPDKKNDYQLIDLVSFKDSQFSPRRLLVNPNLTAIIGGKSTGKSVLLRNIAKTIDSEEVNRRLADVGLNDYPKQIDDFEVVWKDGQSQKISSQERISKKIIYIPQSYFNRLVDNEEGKTSIDDILKGVLEQTDEIRQSYSNLENEQRDTKKTISNTIENLFFTLEDWQRQHLKIREKGDKIGIQQGIANLAKEIDVLKASSGMSEDELLKYNQSRANIDGLRDHNAILEKDIKVLSGLKPLPLISVDTDSLSDEIKQESDAYLSLILHEAQDKWSTFITDYIKQLEEVRIANDLVLSKEQKIVEPLIAKLANATQLTNLSAMYDFEMEKLKHLQVEEQALDKHAAEYNRELNKLSQVFGKYFDQLNATKEAISRSQETLSDIEFELSVEFKSKYFQNEFIEEVFNLKQISKFSEVTLLNYIWTNADAFQSDIYKLVTGIMNESIVLKKNYNKKEALTKLLQNWYILKYNIRYKGDNLSQMSPGKKSFVLLKLLLDLDNSRCPLLLDQPEDDLDNRSIYDELVAYIKKSKKNRQIIIVTHNPNLVVSADAEEVIVANQQGDESLNETYQFEYISNALENSYHDYTSQFTLKKQGIKEHVCDILEGGELAFQKRSEKYNI